MFPSDSIDSWALNCRLPSLPELSPQDPEVSPPAWFSHCPAGTSSTQLGHYTYLSALRNVLEDLSKACIVAHYLPLVFASPTALELRNNDLLFSASPNVQMIRAGLAHRAWRQGALPTPLPAQRSLSTYLRKDPRIRVLVNLLSVRCLSSSVFPAPLLHHCQGHSEVVTPWRSKKPRGPLCPAAGLQGLLGRFEPMPG